MPENPFEEFEGEFKSAEKAAAGSSIGRLPEHIYKGVCTTVDLAGDGVMVDKSIFGGGDKSKGLKIFLEILEPEKVGEVSVKGEIHEHVFWVTTKMLPYIKRDASTILGKEITTMAELASAVWAGRPVEFGLKDDTYQGFTRSKVTFFNAWDPKAPKKEDPKKGKTAGGAKKEPAKTEAAGAAKPPADF